MYVLSEGLMEKHGQDRPCFLLQYTSTNYVHFDWFIISGKIILTFTCRSSAIFTALGALPAFPEIQPFSSEWSESGSLMTKSIITFLCSLGTLWNSLPSVQCKQCVSQSWDTQLEKTPLNWPGGLSSYSIELVKFGH